MMTPRTTRHASHEKTRRDAARRDETRRDETRRDETRRDETKRNETRRDQPKPDKTRRDETKTQRVTTSCLHGLVAAHVVVHRAHEAQRAAHAARAVVEVEARALDDLPRDARGALAHIRLAAAHQRDVLADRDRPERRDAAVHRVVVQRRDVLVEVLASRSSSHRDRGGARRDAKEWFSKTCSTLRFIVLHIWPAAAGT